MHFTLSDRIFVPEIYDVKRTGLILQKYFYYDREVVTRLKNVIICFFLILSSSMYKESM